jgi:hypothetical protein
LILGFRVIPNKFWKSEASLALLAKRQKGIVWRHFALLAKSENAAAVPAARLQK